jgi:uncharacterized membrane protein
VTYVLLNFAHVLGAILIGAGLIGVLLSDWRSRQVRELGQFAEAVRNIAVFYDGLVVPGALLLLASGTWLIVEFFSGWDFIKSPWLAGMVGLFLFEFVEGNTVTRLYFMRLRRLTDESLRAGRFTPELENARAESVPTFTHFLDLPMLLIIVALGTIKPDTWALFFTGCFLALAIGAALTVYVPKLYPWGTERSDAPVGGR